MIVIALDSFCYISLLEKNPLMVECFLEQIRSQDIRIFVSQVQIQEVPGLKELCSRNKNIFVVSQRLNVPNADLYSIAANGKPTQQQLNETTLSKHLIYNFLIFLEKMLKETIPKSFAKKSEKIGKFISDVILRLVKKINPKEYGGIELRDFLRQGLEESAIKISLKDDSSSRNKKINRLVNDINYIVDCWIHDVNRIQVDEKRYKKLHTVDWPPKFESLKDRFFVDIADIFNKE